MECVAIDDKHNSELDRTASLILTTFPLNYFKKQPLILFKTLKFEQHKHTGTQRTLSLFLQRSLTSRLERDAGSRGQLVVIRLGQRWLRLFSL